MRRAAGRRRMTMLDADALQDVVSSRHDLLARVSAGGIRKRDLVDDLGVSRSTVDRSVRELERTGLVERRDGKVHLTMTGSIALDLHDHLLDRFQEVVRAERLLDSLPADAPLAPVVLEEADVVLSGTTSHYRPMSCLDDLVRRSNRIHLCTHGLCAPQVETFRASVVGNGLDATLVVTDDVLDRLVADFPDAMQEMLRTGRVDLLRTDEALPYGVVVGECDDGEEMGLGVYTEVGMVGYVRNDGDAAVEWARDRTATYTAAATRVGAVGG
jgi:predicted transcriptional regulator